MRALDPVVAADNIRVAAIHPWFAGALTHCPMDRDFPIHSFLIISPERHIDPRSFYKGPPRWSSVDARPTHSGRRLPRSDRPGHCDERMPVGVTRRRTCDQGREGGTSCGCV